MPRGKRTLVLATALASLLVALPAGGAGAATRSSFPQGFYGVNYSGNVELLKYQNQQKLWDKLAQGGAESARLLFNWEIAEQSRGHYNFSRIDALVASAAKRHMSVLPVVEYAPKWAKRFPGKAQSPPKAANVADYANFLKALIKRYGPGTLLTKADFWKAYPQLPYLPIKEWEVWNEPEIRFHWYRDHKNWGAGDAKDYVSLLKASYTAIRSADPTAKVVLAALSINSWTNLQHLYDWTDIEGRFDIAAVQAYSGTVAYVPTILHKVRDVLNAPGHAAASTPIYVTEMTWPAAKGKAHPNYTTGYMAGFLTDKNGAAKRLKNAYAKLRNGTLRSQMKLQRVFWYTAATPYVGSNEFDYSGLLNFNGKVITYPVFASYQTSAREAEGCAKSSIGLCK